jgi:hypothetical protein
MTTRPGYVWDATASEWVEIGQAAVLAPIKYQTSQPSSPATGDIWIDSDEDVPSVDSTLYYRWTKTMSGGETSLSGTDNNSLALKYTPGYESVFINGVLQVRGSDYVATTGTTVTGLIALTASDVVMVESIIAYSVGDTYTQTQISSLLDAKSPVSTTGLVLLNTTTFSSAVSSINVNDAFSTTYQNYQIVIAGSTTSAATGGNVTMRFRASGADDSSANYSYAGLTMANASGTIQATGQTSAIVGFTGYNIANSGWNSTTINVFRPFEANWTHYLSSSHGVNSSNQEAFLTAGGALRVATSYTGFTLFFPVSATGTIKVYGYK